MGAAVTISNVQQVQAGKYYVLVTNAAGCTHLDSVMITINPRPLATTSFSAITICEGDTVQLVGSGGMAYQWIPGTGLSSALVANPLAYPATSVDYRVIVFNQFNCTDTAIISVKVIKKPVANAGPDQITISGIPVQLSAAASGQNIRYSWSPRLYLDDTLSLEPIVSPPAPGELYYTLTVVSNDGCGTAVDRVKVVVYNDLFIPTAFTPDGDGLNDTWNIPALTAFPNFELFVYNRYGEMVFQSKKVNTPWDGKYKGQLQPVGTYIYLIDLRTGGRILKGNVTIIR